MDALNVANQNSQEMTAGMKGVPLNVRIISVIIIITLKKRKEDMQNNLFFNSFGVIIFVSLITFTKT